MKQVCIDAVQAAIKRTITQAEADAIESRIRKHMRLLARKDNAAWLGLSEAERLTAAADAASKELVHEAKVKKLRAAQTIIAKKRLDDTTQRFAGNEFEAPDRTLDFVSDDRSGGVSVYSQARAISHHALGLLYDVWRLDKQGRLDFIREAHGQKTGNAQAAQAYKTFREVSESLRQRFNRTGGDVHYLEDWGIPHHHSQARIAAAGFDTWSQKTLGWIDRERYYNEDGTRMTDAQMLAFLKPAFATIVTNGVNKMTPGQSRGSGMRANSGNASRQIHFKDGDAFMAYQAEFGERGLIDVLTGHVSRMARDIALLETFGPNPHHQMRLWLDEIEKRALEKSLGADEAKIRKRRTEIEHLYAEVAGTHDRPVNQTLHDWFSAYRSSNVFGKLGFAVWTATGGDAATALITAHHNKIPVMRLFMDSLRQLNPLNAADRERARREGLGIDALLNSMNRFGADGLGETAAIAGKIAQTSQSAARLTMKMTGMNYWTGAGRTAFSEVFLDKIGGLTRRFDWANLPAEERQRMQAHGIEEQDFALWRLAETQDWRGVGDSVLTANAIYKLSDAQIAPVIGKQLPDRARDQAATRLLAMAFDEAHMAVIEAGARDRARMFGGSATGTWKGELWRSFLQFKSFPYAMITSHWKRAMAQPGWGKAGYLSSLIVTSTMMSMMSMQMAEIAKGNDPLDMTDWRNWMKALLKGGALSLYGDFLFSDRSGYGRSALVSAAGPIASDFDVLAQVAIDHWHKKMRGEKTHDAAEFMRLLRGHLPAVNWWYTKAAFDHMIFNDLQEMLSPGYLRRVRERDAREFGKSAWWPNNKALPQRAPDFAQAVGE